MLCGPAIKLTAAERILLVGLCDGKPTRRVDFHPSWSSAFDKLLSRRLATVGSDGFFAITDLGKASYRASRSGKDRR